MRFDVRCVFHQTGGRRVELQQRWRSQSVRDAGFPTGTCEEKSDHDDTSTREHRRTRNYREHTYSIGHVHRRTCTPCDTRRGPSSTVQATRRIRIARSVIRFSMDFVGGVNRRPCIISPPSEHRLLQWFNGKTCEPATRDIQSDARTFKILIARLQGRL